MKLLLNKTLVLAFASLAFAAPVIANKSGAALASQKTVKSKNSFKVQTFAQDCGHILEQIQKNIERRLSIGEKIALDLVAQHEKELIFLYDLVVQQESLREEYKKSLGDSTASTKKCSDSMAHLEKMNAINAECYHGMRQTIINAIQDKKIRDLIIAKVKEEEKEFSSTLAAIKNKTAQAQKLAPDLQHILDQIQKNLLSALPVAQKIILDLLAQHEKELILFHNLGEQIANLTEEYKSSLAAVAASSDTEEVTSEKYAHAMAQLVKVGTANQERLKKTALTVAHAIKDKKIQELLLKNIEALSGFCVG